MLIRNIINQMATTDTSNIDFKKRHDGKVNIWKLMTIKDENGEDDLKWVTIQVVNSVKEAKEFVSANRLLLA